MTAPQTEYMMEKSCGELMISTFRIRPIGSPRGSRTLRYVSSETDPKPRERKKERVRPKCRFLRDVTRSPRLVYMPTRKATYLQQMTESASVGDQ